MVPYSLHIQAPVLGSAFVVILLCAPRGVLVCDLRAEILEDKKKLEPILPAIGI